jgi:hypothetical protein
MATGAAAWPCQPDTELFHGACHLAQSLVSGRIRATYWPTRQPAMIGPAMTGIVELAVATVGGSPIRLLIQESFMRRIGSIAPRGKSSGVERKQSSLETATGIFVLHALSFRSGPRAFFLLMTTFGAGKPDHRRFRRPSPFPCMEGHGPGVTFWTCDQQLIRLHCVSSAIV